MRILVRSRPAGRLGVSDGVVDRLLRDAEDRQRQPSVADGCRPRLCLDQMPVERTPLSRTDRSIWVSIASTSRRAAERRGRLLDDLASQHGFLQAARHGSSISPRRLDIRLNFSRRRDSRVMSASVWSCSSCRCAASASSASSGGARLAAAPLPDPRLAPRLRVFRLSTARRARNRER